MWRFKKVYYKIKTSYSVKKKGDDFLKNPIGKHFVVILEDEEEKIKN